MDDLSLFDASPFAVAVAEPQEKLSADRRRTLRQSESLAAGRHPLTGGRLHPQAAPADDRQAEGRRCGNCRFRSLIHTNGNRQWPKCLFGAEHPTDTVRGRRPRVTSGAGSDVRRWWPGCADHVYGDPGLSSDAARWVPEAVGADA